MGDNETDELEDGLEEDLPEQADDNFSYAAMAADEDYTGGTDSGALDTGDGFDDGIDGGMPSYGANELYDIDESPEPDKNNLANFRDDSADFSEFGGSGNEYNQQFGNGSSDVIGVNDAAMEGEDAIFMRDMADAQALAAREENFTDDFDEPEQDDFDGEDDDKTQGDDEQGENGRSEKTGKQNTGKEAALEKEPDGPIKWKKGDEITLDLLYQVWGECKHIEKIKSLVESANKAVMEAINTTGPNLALKLNDYITKVTDKNKDTIDCLLDLTKKTGKRLVFVTTSVIEAFFDQQWMQTALLATLPKALQAAIATNPLKGILNAIFTVAVPVINKKAQKR